MAQEKNEIHVKDAAGPEVQQQTVFYFDIIFDLHIRNITHVHNKLKKNE